MSERRVFKFREPEERRNNHIGSLPAIDKKRATAILVRQSGIDADTTHGESRETQLGLQDYGKLLYGNDKPNVLLYDEGAGVSGQKRIDQRKKLDLLYQDMNKGTIGTIVVAREDRLFRNKHMDQVGVFTKLAEEKKIIVVVPPISPTANDEETRVYDFTVYKDLCAFQDKMRESYGYIEGHVKHMHQCQQNKADKGGYDGRGLPPGLAVKGKKQDQIIVIYEPWAKKMRELAKRAQALDWDMGKLSREVANMAFMLPEIRDEDKERYIFKIGIDHTPEVGYKPRKINTVRAWLTNVMYIGWWQPKDDKPDTIKDHHSAILDYDLFAEGYARLTGYTLEGEPVDSPRGITRIRKKREVAPDALFHGKLIATPPSEDRTAFTSIDEARDILYYRGSSMQTNGMFYEKIFCISVMHFDTIVTERLKTLENADREMKERVKTTLEQVYNQQSEDFVSIHDQLAGIAKQLQINARKIANENDEELEKELRAKREELLAIQADLEHKKDKLGLIDSPDEIELLHRLLGNFDPVYSTFTPEQRQRAFSLLINRIEVEVIAPHWLRLSIDWLDAICPRLDIAYVWKRTPSRGKPLNEQESEIIKQHYPTSPRLEILKLLPDRTWVAIRRHAVLAHIQRDVPTGHVIPQHVCYRDFMPKLDGNYLFRDYETTLDYIQKASSTTQKSDQPFHAIWIYPEKDEDLARLVEEDLNRRGYGGGLPTKSWLLSLEGIMHKRL